MNDNAICSLKRRCLSIVTFTAAALIIVTATPANAVIISLEYTATIKTVTGTPFGLTVPLNTPMTGTIQYDAATPDSNGSTTAGTYAHVANGAFAADFLGHRVTGSATPTWTVSQADTLRAYDGPRTIGPEGGVMTFDSTAGSDIQLLLAITPKNSALLPNDHLPNPWPAFQFGFLGDPHTFSLSSTDGTMLMQFSSVQQVPEPTGALLFAIAAATVAIAALRPWK